MQENKEVIIRARNILEEINKISSSMCLAKWLHSTVHLQLGLTHSCCHSNADKIHLEEIKTNPTALHNTKFKKSQRHLMLQGKRPAECDYCWNVEDQPGDRLSERAFKSAYPSSWLYKDNVLTAGATGNILPSYLEVSFDNTCNFKCAYCLPEISSKWLEEIKQFGPYPTSAKHNDLAAKARDGIKVILNREKNPYMDAFWKWWPELYNSLHTFRITGGEPLLSKNTWKVFDHVLQDPRPELNLAVNSNMDVPENLQHKLIHYANKLHGKVKSFDLFTSAEATGIQCEYIRFGMNYERFVHSVESYLESTPGHVNFMVAFSLLSVTTFDQFLEWVYTLRKRFNPNLQENRIGLSINYATS